MQLTSAKPNELDNVKFHLELVRLSVDVLDGGIPLGETPMGVG